MSYQIEVSIKTEASMMILKDNLQEAYDNGVAGCFNIKMGSGSATILFDRSEHDDHDYLMGRLENGEQLEDAARNQLASELSELGDKMLAPIIAALRTNAAVKNLPVLAHD